MFAFTACKRLQKWSAIGFRVSSIRFIPFSGLEKKPVLERSGQRNYRVYNFIRFGWHLILRFVTQTIERDRYESIYSLFFST